MYFGEPFGGLLPGARGAVLAVLLRTDTPLTGRQIHGLVRDRFSLSPVQDALRNLNRLGITETRTVGRAGVHSINEHHYAVPHLRALVDPVAALRAVVDKATRGVDSVILFGSIARGESTETSDVDLAVIAPNGWDGHLRLEDAVRERLGNDCDVVVFTPAEFDALANSGEPVVHEILRDGVAVVGVKPPAGAGRSW